MRPAGAHYIAAGFCPGGYGYLMKRVLAVEGDAVSVGDDGVRVNGGLLPASAPRPRRQGRPAVAAAARRPASRSAAAKSCRWRTRSATSFDGRYFGAVRLSQVSAVITPVVTWSEQQDGRPFIGGQRNMMEPTEMTPAVQDDDATPPEHCARSWPMPSFPATTPSSTPTRRQPPAHSPRMH